MKFLKKFFNRRQAKVYAEGAYTKLQADYQNLLLSAEESNRKLRVARETVIRYEGEIKDLKENLKALQKDYDQLSESSLVCYATGVEDGKREGGISDKNIYGTLKGMNEEMDKIESALNKYAPFLGSKIAHPITEDLSGSLSGVK